MNYLACVQQEHIESNKKKLVVSRVSSITLDEWMTSDADWCKNSYWSGVDVICYGPITINHALEVDMTASGWLNCLDTFYPALKLLHKTWPHIEIVWSFAPVADDCYLLNYVKADPKKLIANMAKEIKKYKIKAMEIDLALLAAFESSQVLHLIKELNINVWISVFPSFRLLPDNMGTVFDYLDYEYCVIKSFGYRVDTYLPTNQGTFITMHAKPHGSVAQFLMMWQHLKESVPHNKVLMEVDTHVLKMEMASSDSNVCSQRTVLPLLKLHHMMNRGHLNYTVHIDAIVGSSIMTYSNNLISYDAPQILERKSEVIMGEGFAGVVLGESQRDVSPLSEMSVHRQMLRFLNC